MAAVPSDKTTPVPTSITLLATGDTAAGGGAGGLINMRGNQGVRITAGPPLSKILPTTSEGTSGIELMVNDGKTITLQQGVIPMKQRIFEINDTGVTTSVANTDSIRMDHAGSTGSILMGSSSIDIDAGMGSASLKCAGPLTIDAGPSAITVKSGSDITLQSTKSITLQVAGGVASITITGKAVTIKGLKVNVN